jgi:hypothetical protein
VSGEAIYISYDSEEHVLDSCTILNGLFVNGAGVEKIAKRSCICDLAASGR